MKTYIKIKLKIIIVNILFVGFVVEFVSMPVTGGFTSAAAIIMASSQIKGLFGISYDAKNCMDMWIKLIENFKHIQMADTAMGVICICVLIGLNVSNTHLKSLTHIFFFLP